MRVDHVELELIAARARRERAEAVYAMIVAPLVRLFTASRAPRSARPAGRRLAA